MRRLFASRIAPLIVAAAMAAPLGIQPVEAAHSPSPSVSHAVPADVFAAALRIEGDIVKRSSGVTVERVLVPPALRAAGRNVPASVWRVTVEGRFLPRALRYVVLAGGRPVGYGIPTANQHSLRTVTTNASVLTGPITTRYGDRSPRPASPVQPTFQRPLIPSRMPNPASSGPLEVTRTVYDLGDEVFQPSAIGAKVELIADVHYPTGLPAGPYPLVLFMHGNHSTCYRGNRARYQWPCRDGWEALPNYAGYDYIAQRLASHGFVVASVSANGVNVFGNFVEDTGMRQRGEVLEKHIDLWRTWSTTGAEPFGTTFVGKVDMTRIGTMGHSRGGEGVVWNKIVDDERSDPYGIDAVLALAPVDFTRVTINNSTFAVVLPYCDGDVYDLQGVHFFDDSRYLVPGDPTPKHTVTSFGANHNFFNTVWSPSSGFPGTWDDSDCRNTGGLTERQQRRVGRAYIAGFFRRYLTDAMGLDRMWTGAVTPRSIQPARTLVSYLAADTATHRMDLARFTDPQDLFRGQTGGAVSQRGLSVYGWCANTWEIPCVPGRYAWTDIHLPGLTEGLVGWSDPEGVLEFTLPEDSADVSAFSAFQFRAVVNPGYDANYGIKFQDLAVALIDGSGNSAEVIASDVGNAALAFPLTGRRGRGHTILHQVRFPLERFEGVDLSDLDSVELRFSRTEIGVLNIADVAFSRGGPQP